MALHFPCTSCARTLEASEAFAGCAAKCPACDSVNVVPSDPARKTPAAPPLARFIASRKLRANARKSVPRPILTSHRETATAEVHKAASPQHPCAVHHPQNLLQASVAARPSDRPCLFARTPRSWLTKGEISSPWTYRLLGFLILASPLTLPIGILLCFADEDIATPAAYALYSVLVYMTVGPLILTSVSPIIDNARYRYFHNGTLGRFEAAQQVASNAERYRLLLGARDFLFRQRTSGRLFQARWKQNFALFIAYGVVHRTVRQYEGRPPPTRHVIAEYHTTIAKMRQHQHMNDLTDEDIEHMVGRVVAFYERLSQTERSTFFPIGELARAVGDDIRVSIFPYRFGNQEEDDLGLTLDAIFNIAVQLEDAYRDAPQAIQLINVRELADRKGFPYQLMHLEQRLF